MAASEVREIIKGVWVREKRRGIQERESCTAS